MEGGGLYSRGGAYSRRFTVLVKYARMQATSSQSSEISSKSKRFYSPSPNSKQNTSQKRFRSKRNLNDNHEDNSRPALINLCDDNQTSVVEDEPVGFEYPNIEQYISPTQKYFDKVETDEQKLRVLAIEEKEQDLLELQESFRELEDFIKLPLCSYCHAPDHNCLFTPCESASYCHDIKRRPDENKFLKERKEELKTSKGKLHRLQDDLKGKSNSSVGEMSHFSCKYFTNNSELNRFISSSRKKNLE